MTDYLVRFDNNPRTDVTITAEADHFHYEIGNEIARQLGIMRYEIEIGDHGGAIRPIGSDGPGMKFTITKEPTS